jgi:hypothetical protein
MAMTKSGIGGGGVGIHRALSNLGGRELILDADGDTSITADTDDQIDIRIGGSDLIVMAAAQTTFTQNILTANAAGPALINTAANTTTPTLIPNQVETDTGIGWASDTLHVVLGGSNEVAISTASLSPGVSNGSALGTTSLMWADLFLADAGVINFNNGEITLTHADLDLTLEGTSPVLIIKANNDGATGGIIEFVHNTASMAATGGQDTGDRIGAIAFHRTDGTLLGEISCAMEGSTTQAGFHFRLKGDATNDKLYITRDGNATLLGTLTESSDVSLKANVANLTGALAKVNSMRGVSFTRNDLSDKTSRHAGLIAQELEAITPELVVTGTNNLKSIAYAQLVAYLIEAVKEVDAKVEAL